MQWVLDFLKDENCSPDPGRPAWVLGKRYEFSDDKWSEAFLSDINRLIWLMYRTQFATPIPRHPDGPSPLLQTMNAFLRSGTYSDPSSIAGYFTSDVGWGCMIRTGQSLLANALLKLASASNPTDSIDSVGDTRELDILRKFSDDPEAVYSIHRFVDYGASRCGKLPGQWFGPSAVASCIAHFAEDPVSVYISSGMDVFEQDLLELKFPILVLCGLRLGIQEINPIYYEGLQLLLSSKQSVGIAGGRTSASHYFYGFQGNRLFYHDPHEPKQAVTMASPDADFLESMHSQKLRTLNMCDMDPSMLAGFLLTSQEDYEDWKKQMNSLPWSSRTVNISNVKPMAGSVEDISDAESIDEGNLSSAKESCEKPRGDQPLGPGSSVRSDPASSHTAVPISQESLITVDKTEASDESIVEVSKTMG